MYVQYVKWRKYKCGYVSAVVQTLCMYLIHICSRCRWEMLHIAPQRYTAHHFALMTTYGTGIGGAYYVHIFLAIVCDWHSISHVVYNHHAESFLAEYRCTGILCSVGRFWSVDNFLPTSSSTRLSLFAPGSPETVHQLLCCSKWLPRSKITRGGSSAWRSIGAWCWVCKDTHLGDVCWKWRWTMCCIYVAEWAPLTLVAVLGVDSAWPLHSKWPHPPDNEVKDELWYTFLVTLAPKRLVC